MGIVRKRIMLLLYAVAVLFILGIAGWQLQEQHRSALLYKQESSDTCRTADKLVELRGKTLANLAVDYTYWDEMVDFVKTRDPKWAKNNLAPAMGTYGADAITVCNPSGAKVYSVDSFHDSSLRIMDIRPEQIRRLFAAGPFRHFFLQTRRGLLEVRGAKIVPSADPKHTGPPQGYFLAFRIWDSSYVEELGSLIEGNASLQPTSTGRQITPGERKHSMIVFRKSLRGPDGRSLQTLCVTKRFTEGDVQRTASRMTIILMGFLAVLMITVLFFGLTRFVAHPLGLISSAMETQSPDTLSHLEKDPSEFGRLATLIRKFFLQRAVLEHEMQERARAEKDIKKSEKNLSTTLNSIGDGVISTDAQGRVIRMNPAAEELTGWSVSEVAGLPISKVLNIVDALTHEPAPIPVDEVLSTGEVCHLATHTTLISRDGTERQIADSAAPIRDESGAVTGVVLVFSDVTEQYRIREELKEAGDRAQRYLNIAGVIMLSITRDQTVTLINKQGCELLGYPRQELFGRNWFDVCIPEREREEVKVTFDQLMRGEFEPVEFFENDVITRSGEERTISWHNVLLRDVAGAIIGTLSSGEDVTERKQAEEALRESEEQYRVIFEGSAHGILMTDSETGRFMYANPSICRMLGYTENELLQLGVPDIHPKDSLEYVASEFEAQARGEKTLAAELPCLRKDGTVFYADVTSTLTTIKGGRECTVGFFTDVTDRRDLSQQLEVAATQIRGLMTQVVTGNSLAGRFKNPCLSRCWEEKKCTKTECPSHGNHENLRCWEVAGTSCGGKVQGTFAQKFGDCSLCEVYRSARANPLLELGETFNAMSAILEQRHTELSQAKAELETVNAQLEDALLDSNEYAVSLEVAKGETEEKAVELSHQANHDALTGLPNRHYFEQHLSELITGSAGKKSRSFVVLFLDLDKFKLINDTLGHKVGDLLLIGVAERMQSCLRSEDILARMGGDEFTVILPQGVRRATAELVASRMIDSISRPFEIDRHKFVISASIGLASYPSDGMDTVTLLKHADVAMYKAKQSGRGTFRWYSGDVDVENQQRADVEMDIRAALEKGQFNVYYQPIVSLEDGEILSAEALLRWEHPEKGMISPSLFIPIAEEIGIIGQIGDYVLRTACAHTMAWRDEGIHLSQIAVNVSTRQVSDASWLDSVSAALSDTGLDARCLNLEVTETDFAADYESMRETLQKVQKLGICMAIDDFGMGQSSLSRLKEFPVIHLKIDGSFVRDIEHNKNDNALVRSIVEMAHGQGIKVTAEWVETEAQMEILRSIGCDFAQGYFISPALTTEAFGDFVREWTLARRAADAA